MNVPPPPYVAPAAPMPPPPPPARTPWTTGRILAFAASPGFLVAVLAFFLPWYAVSCSGQTLASATGFQAASSGFQDSADNPFSQLDARSPSLDDFDHEEDSASRDDDRPRVRAGNPSFSMGKKTTKNSKLDELRGESMAWMFAYPVLCLLGVGAALGAALSQAGRAKLLSLVAGGVAAAGVALQCVQLFSMQSRLHDALAHDPALSSKGNETTERVAAAVARSITVDARGGWYLALLALVVAAILVVSGMLARRSEPRA